MTMANWSLLDKVFATTGLAVLAGLRDFGSRIGPDTSETVGHALVGVDAWKEQSVESVILHE